MSHLTICTPVKQYFDFEVDESLIGGEKIWARLKVDKVKTVGETDALLRQQNILLVGFGYMGKGRVTVNYRGDFSGERFFIWVGFDKVARGLKTKSDLLFPNYLAFSHAFGPLHDCSNLDDEIYLREMNEMWKNREKRDVALIF